MPELPDIQVYLDALGPRIVGRPIERVTVVSPFVIRTVDPPIGSIEGAEIIGLRRLGKRIVWELADELFVVIHLMVAGRFRWSDRREVRLARKVGLAMFGFPDGTLSLIETGTRKRASIHVLRGEAALADHDPGGLEVLDADLAAFTAALRREQHTLKRALTDPRLFSGIGNAFSDEILLAAGLSPLDLTQKLDAGAIERLHRAARETLTGWIERLRAQFGGRFPDPRQIRAFRPGFGAHGRYGQPCPRCGTTIQRIRYAESEANYCPRCQTRGKVLADRSMSRLLKGDWPGTIKELERRQGRRHPTAGA